MSIVWFHMQLQRILRSQLTRRQVCCDLKAIASYDLIAARGLSEQLQYVLAISPDRRPHQTGEQES